MLKRTFEIGETVTLAKPRKGKRPDGSEYVVTTRRSLTGEHVHAHAAEVVAILVAHGVTKLVIEQVDQARVPSDNPAAAQSIVTAIHRTSWVSGAVGVEARHAGIEVEWRTRGAWVGRVVQRKKKGTPGGDAAEQIPAAIQAGYIGWPDVSTEHERDAAGVLLSTALPERAAKPERAPRKARVARVDALELEPTKAERAKLEREAASAACVCPSEKGRHRRECPLAKRQAKREPRGYAAWKARQEAASVACSR